MSNLDYCIQKASQIPFIRGQKRLWCIVLDSKGRMVSEAANSYSKTHTSMFNYGRRTGNPQKCYLHSEVAALLKDRKRRGVKLIVARVDSKGVPCLAMPCPACTLAIQEFSNIKSVEYTV